MILVLDTTTRKLQAQMGAAATTSNCTITVAYAETTASSFTEGMQPTTLAGLTVTDILAAPSVAATRRVVKAIMIYNNDTVTQTVTVYLDDNGTDYPLVKVTLGPGANWASDDQTGVNVGGGVTDGNKGDIVVGNSGATWNIRTDMPGGAVTLAKMADLTASKLIGREASGSGVPQQIGATGGIEFTGTGTNAAIQVGAFSGEVGKTAGSSTLTITDSAVVTARLADGAVTPAKLSVTAQALSFRNRLINGDFSIDQRNDGAATNIADDVYCLDRWYVLAETGNVQASRILNAENGSPTCIQLQAQTSSKRFGIAQIIESINCRDLRGESVVLNFRMRSNAASQTIRYAILEWTGTADQLTSDIVNSWSNGTFTIATPATFFINTTGFVLVATGNVTTSSSANTWTSLSTPLTGTIGSTMNNLIVFLWTENQALTSTTINFSQVQLERGTTATAFERMPFDVSLNRCQRYFYLYVRMNSFTGGAGTQQNTGLLNGYYSTASQCEGILVFPVPMRTIPTGVASANPGYYGFFSGSVDVFQKLSFAQGTIANVLVYANNENGQNPNTNTDSGVSGTTGASGRFLMRGDNGINTNLAGSSFAPAGLPITFDAEM